MGLLDYISQKAQEIPANARAAYRGLLAAPEELAALFSPGMLKGVNQAMNTPATLDRDKAVGMAMDYLQTTPAGLLGHIVYHGSPHKFYKFDMSKIGTGEGAQAYGHGLYFAESPDVAKSYLKAGGGGKQLTVTLPNNQSLYGDQITDKGLEAIKYLERGAQDAGQFKHNTAYYAKRYTQDPDVQKLIDEWKDAKVGYKDHSTFYKVDIPDEAIPRMLDWDKPLSKQAPEVRAALENVPFETAGGDWTGSQLIDAANAYARQGANDVMSRNPQGGSELLRAAGIPGIRYLDGNSRGAGQGTSNFVLFDDQLPRILEVNGQPTGLLSYADEAAQKPKPKKAK